MGDESQITTGRAFGSTDNLSPGLNPVLGVDFSPCVDSDGEGTSNDGDKCPYRSNPDQLDQGGVGSALPDGIGDACQCGDVDDNGIVDEFDVDLFRAFLSDPNGLPFSPEGRARCTVSRNSSDCDILDLAALRRALLWLPPGIADSCGADS